MKLIVYDVEVFKFDWIVVFKDVETGIHTVIHNDSEALRECLYDDGIYVGFNSKHYDQFIIKAAANDFSPQEIKQLNDFLIGGGRGWEYAPLKAFYFRFNNVDIRDDVQLGLSLKAIEGHMGMDIQETEVSFDLDRPLTEEELQQTVHYIIKAKDLYQAFKLWAKSEGAYVLSARKFNAEMERHPEWFDRKSTSSGFMIYWGLKLKEVV